MDRTKISSSRQEKQRQNLVAFISNVCVLGFSYSGKSSLVKNFTKQFSNSNAISFSSIYETDRIYTNLARVKFKIWDYDGSSKQKDMRLSSLKISMVNKVGLVVFDLTNRNSFDNMNDVIKQWLQSVQPKQKQSFIILGTKRDLEVLNQRQVQFDEGLNKAKELKTLYLETSDKQDNDMIFLKALIFQQSRQSYCKEIVLKYIKNLKQDMQSHKASIGIKNDKQINQIRYIWESKFSQSYYKIKAKANVVTQKMRQAIRLSLELYKVLRFNLHETESLKKKIGQVQGIVNILIEGYICPQAQSLKLRDQLMEIHVRDMLSLDGKLKQSSQSLNQYLLKLQKLSNIYSPLMKELHKKQNHLGILQQFIQKLQKNVNINLGKQKINKQQIILQNNQNKPKSAISLQSDSYSIESVQFCLSISSYNNLQMLQLLHTLKSQFSSLSIITQCCFEVEKILEQLTNLLNKLRLKLYENKPKQSISEIEVINFLLKLYISSTQNEYLGHNTQENRGGYKQKQTQKQKDRLCRKIQSFSQSYLDSLSKIVTNQYQRMQDIQSNILSDLLNRRKLKLMINQMQILEYWIEVRDRQLKKQEGQFLFSKIKRFFHT